MVVQRRITDEFLDTFERVTVPEQGLLFHLLALSIAEVTFNFVSFCVPLGAMGKTVYRAAKGTVVVEGEVGQFWWGLL